MPPCTFGRCLTADDLRHISGMHETPGSSLTREQRKSQYSQSTRQRIHIQSCHTGEHTSQRHKRDSTHYQGGRAGHLTPGYVRAGHRPGQDAMRMPPCTFGRYLTADDLSRISGMHETPGSSLTREQRNFLKGVGLEWAICTAPNNEKKI